MAKRRRQLMDSQMRLLESPVYQTIGFDPALRHGMLVVAQWQLGEDPKLLGYEKVVHWEAVRGRGLLGAKSSLTEIQNFVNWVISEVVKNTGPTPLGVDWHPMMTFWGNRKAGITLTYMMGYLCRAFETLGYPVVFFDPAHVRKQFGLTARGSKEAVWEQFSFFPEEAQDEDERDALILSYLVAKGLEDS